MPEMLKEIDEQNTYPIYSLLCQTSHGGHHSTWMFRGEGVGTEKKRGEFITDEMWAVPLAVSRFVFMKPGLLMLKHFALETARLQTLIGD